MTYFIVGYEYTWWRGDELPTLPPLEGFRAGRTEDVQLLAHLHGLDVPAIEDRLQTGNAAYLAFLDGEPVAYGWIAAQTVGIVDAGVSWPLGQGDRGLWDFATLEQWRGRGIYPRLLQAILRAEEKNAGCFWIGHRGDNEASRRGILKAGFQLSNVVVLSSDFQPRSVPRGDRQRALASPQGKHFGFAELRDDDLTLFDFANAGSGPPVDSS